MTRWNREQHNHSGTPRQLQSPCLLIYGYINVALYRFIDAIPPLSPRFQGSGPSAGIHPHRSVGGTAPGAGTAPAVTPRASGVVQHLEQTLPPAGAGIKANPSLPRTQSPEQLPGRDRPVPTARSLGHGNPPHFCPPAAAPPSRYCTSLLFQSFTGFCCA